MRVFFTFCLVLLGYVAFSQRYAVVSGDWNGPIWASTPGGAAGSAATPTALDDVYTNENSVNVNINGTCRNLFVEFDVANSITFGSSLRTLTITGTLVAWDSDNIFEEFPTQDIISDVGRLAFTGSGVTAYAPYVIYAWDPTVSDFGQVSFNLGGGNTFNLYSPISINGVSANKSLAISSGTLRADPGAYIEAKNGASTGVNLTVSAGATLRTDDYVGGASPTLGFSSITIDGTIVTSNYVNAASLNIGGTGALNTSFNGNGQTEGWWYQSARPTGGGINTTGTVVFNANANQNIYARAYGNLLLDGAGTKTLVGAGTLIVSGSLTINSSSVVFSAASSISIGADLINHGTFTPNALVTFNGSGGQQISGTSLTSFNGGININKTAGTLILARNTTVSGGLTIAQGIFDLATYDFTVANGNITNNGTLVPSASTVIIGGATSIGGTSTTAFNNLTITGVFTAPATLNISGNLVNNGTFNPNSGTLVFNGTTDQSISGTLNAYNISVTNTTATNGVLVNGNVNLDGTLTLMNSASKFDADGSGSGVLTVRSNSVNSGGRIATLPTPSNLTGSVTIQRFVNGPDTWRYFSMPITNGNVGMWQDDFPVTGNFSNRSPVGVDGVENNTAPSIYSFNPVTNQYVAVGSGGTTGGTALSNTVGYSAYSYKSGDFTISVRGSVGKGNIPVSVSTANGGYNLVPNPYPSAIDWDNVTKTGLNDALWIRVANDQYASYVGGVAANGPFVGWSGEIATGQSFWVQSTGATSLTFKEADKTSSQYEFLRESAPQDYIRVRLASATQSDETVVRFASDAGENFDSPYDARKKKNGDFSSTLQRYTYLNLSSYVSDPAQDYAINGIATLSECSRNVNLKVEDVSAGDYKLKFSDLDKMHLDYDVILVDNYLNDKFPVVEGAEYNFAVTTDASSKGASRFELSFVAQSIRNVGSDATAQNCGPGRMILDVTGAPDGGSYRWYESADASEPIPNETSSSFTTPLLTESATYFVSVVNGNGCESVLRFPVQAKVVNVDKPAISLNGNVLSVNEGTGIQWYKDDVPIDGATTNQLEVSESGVYKVTTTLDGCTAESDGIEFRVTGVEDEKSSYAFFPNPAADYLQITGPLEGADVEFYDNTGKKVPANIAEADERQIILDLRGVKEGLYFLNLRKKNKVVQRKVLKK